MKFNTFRCTVHCTFHRANPSTLKHFIRQCFSFLIVSHWVWDGGSYKKFNFYLVFVPVLGCIDSGGGRGVLKSITAAVSLSVDLKGGFGPPNVIYFLKAVAETFPPDPKSTHSTRPKHSQLVPQLQYLPLMFAHYHFPAIVNHTMS